MADEMRCKDDPFSERILEFLDSVGRSKTEQEATDKADKLKKKFQMTLLAMWSHHRALGPISKEM